MAIYDGWPRRVDGPTGRVPRQSRLASCSPRQRLDLQAVASVGDAFEEEDQSFIHRFGISALSFVLVSNTKTPAGTVA